MLPQAWARISLSASGVKQPAATIMVHAVARRVPSAPTSGPITIPYHAHAPAAPSASTSPSRCDQLTPLLPCTTKLTPTQPIPRPDHCRLPSHTRPVKAHQPAVSNGAVVRRIALLPAVVL